MNIIKLPNLFQDCGKEFVDSSSLRRHQVIHSGKEGFKCSICSKAFTDRLVIQVHFKIQNIGFICLGRQERDTKTCMQIQ